MDAHVSQHKMKKRQDYTAQHKLDVLTRENAKILQKIVEARQINVNTKGKNLDSIRTDEIRSRSTRDANLRAGLRK